MTGRRISGATLCGAIALLAACQHAPPTAPPEPPRQVETGSRFTLLAPLSFPAGSSELLFQNEQLVPAAKLSRDMPYCKLAREAGAPGALAPGNLTVRRVDYDEREVGSAGEMANVTRIALSAAPNRPGYTMTCGWPAGAPTRGFPTTQQIYNAIGGQFSMDLLR
jgi:hypothetical protein